MINIDEGLIYKAREGDEEAFEEIYRASSSYVYTVALRVTSNREDAQEVVQDVFVSVYRNLKNFRFKAAFKTWIYRITMNMAINKYKKRKKASRRELEFDDELVNVYTKDTVSDDINSRHNERMVQEMLDILPDKQKACVVLKDIEGLKYEEIALALNININTVRSRLKRAREKMISHARKEGRGHEMR